jgi:hypothetical protein
MKQKINMAYTIIRAGITDNFYAVPYSISTIKKLDKNIIALHNAHLILLHNSHMIYSESKHSHYKMPTCVVSGNNYKMPLMIKVDLEESIMTWYNLY